MAHESAWCVYVWIGTYLNVADRVQKHLVAGQQRALAWRRAGQLGDGIHTDRVFNSELSPRPALAPVVRGGEG